MQEDKATIKQRCRRKVPPAGRGAEEEGTRRGEVQENKAPGRQRWRRTRRSAGRGAEERGAKQTEMQENKAPSRQVQENKAPHQTGRGAEEQCVRQGRGARRLVAGQAKVHKNNATGRAEVQENKAPDRHVQKNMQAEKRNRRQTELQTTYLINGLFVRMRGAVLQNINQTTRIRKEEHNLFCNRKNWHSPKYSICSVLRR